MQTITVYGIPVEASGYKIEIKRGIAISCLVRAIEINFGMWKNKKVKDSDFLRLFKERYPTKKFIMQPGNHIFKEA